VNILGADGVSIGGDERPIVDARADRHGQRIVLMRDIVRDVMLNVLDLADEIRGCDSEWAKELGR
jgi:hypothetical protein